ncbi:hypothetical protein PR001_g14887 [Phytophthora rubi]|uniref:Uncharacterized protein n=2 Tax=Phytophthora rubi TaxID=129364 RepID=A0A6A3L7H8_9STRA|nr:hypothetical protein PR001_g14887 [Phytophthora rubi]
MLQNFNAEPPGRDRRALLRLVFVVVAMGHFNRNESMTLVATPEDLPYWMTVKPMIQPKSVPTSTSTRRFRVASSVLGGRSSAKECWLLRAERWYGDFDHFD